MQLPIDFKALIDEATDIKAARSTEVSVSIYIDNAAPGDLVAFVRSAFTSESPMVRLTVSYLDDSFIPHPIDDFAIIAAGDSAVVGPAATAVRAVGVPVMVVTTMPQLVEVQARTFGHAIPEGDIIAPDAAADCPEPYELDDEMRAQLCERMGSWIVSVRRDKRLAMAIAFSFMRRPLAKDAVQATSLQNAGIGLVPVIPGADLPIMTLNQAKMMLQIAAAYGHEMNKDRAKELAAVVGGAYLCRVVARELVEFVPILGFVVKPGIAYGGTAAVGYAAIEYFEGGENAAGIANVASRAAEAGNRLIARVRSFDSSSIPDLATSAQGLVNYVPVVQDKINEYAPKVMAAVNDVLDSVIANTGAKPEAAR